MEIHTEYNECHSDIVPQQISRRIRLEMLDYTDILRAEYLLDQNLIDRSYNVFMSMILEACIQIKRESNKSVRRDKDIKSLKTKLMSLRKFKNGQFAEKYRSTKKAFKKKV
ncbi:hypothetical protein GJ496_009198 [Pomphorhynchus laevis]|nr:hypothetical protein GJ496_009198 [Pomphorhynchus laevis]